MSDAQQGPKIERKPWVMPAKDRERYEALIDGLIRWCNADNEDAITLSRNQVCVIRDGIEDDRRIRAQDRKL